MTYTVTANGSPLLTTQRLDVARNARELLRRAGIRSDVRPHSDARK